MGGPEFGSVAEWARLLTDRLEALPGLTDVEIGYEVNSPQLRVRIDRERADDLGISVRDVGNALQTMLASREITTYVDRGREYPVIVQASAGARKYAGAPFLRHLILAAIEEFPHIPVCMHQDHGTSPDVCQRSIQLGFSSVMMDGSLKEDGKTPADYDYNVRVTKQTVAFAHACGVSVEGELGCLGSLETGTAGEEDGIGAEGVLDHSQMLTDPEEAAQFVRETQVDALAIAIGTSHGAYKFTKPPTGDILAIERIKEIHKRIPNTHLVMHGSSSVPQEWLKVINEFGGDIKETYGVPVEEIVEGIKHGVRKVNIDTDLRLASTGAMRRFMAQNPSEFDPRKFFAKTIDAMRDICIARYEAFGTAGHASKIKPISLEGMFQRYARGELDAKVN